MNAPENRVVRLAAILAALPGKDTYTQRQRMLTAIQELGSVTTFEGSRYLDCYDPRARVHELRKEGARIKTVMRAEQTESGVMHRVGVYIMETGAHG
ncbi:MAG: helix-turn-helix domain-containing protein [Gammaproteobacteria bacterium]